MSEALAPLDDDKFQEFPMINAPDPEKAFEIFRANMGDTSTMNVWNMDVITAPSRGDLRFTIPTPEGPQAVEHIDGVIVGHQAGRTYWHDEFGSSGGGPPDCRSTDMKTGVGEPGGECASCKMNQFGTAHRGQGKACREIKHLFLAVPGSLMPMIIRVTPGSLRYIRDYMSRLASQNIPHYGALTRMYLQEDASKGQAIKYSSIRAKLLGILPDEISARCRILKENVESMFAA